MRTFLIWAAAAFVAISAQKVSTNGRCGPDHGNRGCKGSSYGDCCSQYSWCGSTSDHCGTGCKAMFGTCFSPSPIRSSTLRTSTVPSTRSSSVAASSTRASSAALASPSTPVSRNRRCGNSNGAKGGFTCKGSGFGDCCSTYSYCGFGPAYCGTDCQPEFGTCSSVSSSVRVSTTSSVRVSTTSSVRVSTTSSVRSSSVGSSARSSSASSSVVQLLSSMRSSSMPPVSSSIQTRSVPPTSSSNQISSPTSTQAIAPPSPSAAASSPAVSSVPPSSTISSTSAAETPSPIVVSSALPTPTPIITTPVQLINPSFEQGTGFEATGWTIDRLYVIDAANSGRVSEQPHTGNYAIRGRGQRNGGFDVYLSQTVTVVPGSSYTIEVFAKQLTAGFCSVSIYLGGQAVREFVPPGTTYSSISAVATVATGAPVEQVLLIDGACSLPNEDPAMFDLFIDDVTMTLIV